MHRVICSGTDKKTKVKVEKENSKKVQNHNCDLKISTANCTCLKEIIMK